MKVSLIMTTSSHYESIERFLKSLESQSYKSFELIIIDQNRDDSIKLLLEKYSNKFDVVYKKSNISNYNLNLNKGLLFASGNIIAFPSENSVYEVKTIEKSVSYLYTRAKTIYSCNSDDSIEENFEITKDNVIDNIVLSNLFINIKGDEVLLFDYNFGKNSTFEYYNEADYVLNLLHNNYIGQIIAKDKMTYNEKDVEDEIDKAFCYGALIKKEIKYRKNKLYITKYIKKILEDIKNLIFNKNRKYYYTILKSRINGFFKYNID